MASSARTSATTGDGPEVLTAGAVRWLRDKGALLAGITTLERLVAETEQAADQRLWAHLAGQLSAGQLGLLDTREENRRKYVELERLCKGRVWQWQDSPGICHCGHRDAC